MVKRNVIMRINEFHLGKNVGHKETNEKEVEMPENSWSSLLIPSIISIQFSINVGRTQFWWVMGHSIAKYLPKMVLAQIISDPMQGIRSTKEKSNYPTCS